MLGKFCRSLFCRRFAKLASGDSSSKRTFCIGGGDELLSNVVYTKLTNRSVIRLKGAEVIKFLQGLVTNDVSHFEKNAAVHLTAMYSLILNTQGRVLFDVLLYNRDRDNSQIFIECDKKLSGELQKTLAMYRLRKKIDIDRVDDEMNVYAVYKSDGLTTTVDETQQKIHDLPNLGKVFSCPDPRLSQLGHRVILHKDENAAQVFDRLKEMPDEIYHSRRYRLGIGEGSIDLPTSNCFPLESNADYLNGISFHKGCYVGQELTARTHHTGVVRKRLMPLIFEASDNKPIGFKHVLPDAKILNENQENVGKYRNACGDAGLALLRVDEALKAKALHVQTPDGNGVRCTTYKPDWWLDKNSNLTGEIRGFVPTMTPEVRGYTPPKEPPSVRT